MTTLLNLDPAQVPDDGDSLVYNAASKKWLPGRAGGGFSALTDTRAASDLVALQRRTATEYALWQALGDGRWWRTLLTRSDAIPPGVVVPGGYLNHQLTFSYVTYPAVSVTETDPAVDTSAGTWSAGTNAAAHGGTYVRSNITGDKITFTTPPDTVAVGMHSIDVLNAGVSRVLIDGDPTLANVLPTAQHLVTTGTLPSTVLVANGGPLDPTDRVLDQYAAATVWNVNALLAEELPPGVHTVTIEVTGAKRAASTDTRAYIAGFASTTRTTTPATTGAGDFNRLAVVPRDSAWEYAHSIKPAAASSFVFVGNIHGYETETALSFTLDGATITPGIGGVALGRVLRIDKATNLRHPNTGTTNLADVATTYTLTGNGLRIQHATEWLTDGVCTASYPAMFPTNRAEFPAAMIDTQTADLDLTQGNGQFDGRAQGSLVAAWQPYGAYAAILHIPDPQTTLDGWANSGTGTDPTKAALLSVEDRAADGLGRALAKMYATRISNEIPGGVAYSMSDVWESDALYRAARISRGAASSLSATT